MQKLQEPWDLPHHAAECLEAQLDLIGGSGCVELKKAEVFDLWHRVIGW